MSNIFNMHGSKMKGRLKMLRKSEQVTTIKTTGKSVLSYMITFVCVICALYSVYGIYQQNRTPFNFDITNTGEKSIDVKPVITIKSDKAMNPDDMEFKIVKESILSNRIY